MAGRRLVEHRAPQGIGSVAGSCCSSSITRHRALHWKGLAGCGGAVLCVLQLPRACLGTAAAHPPGTHPGIYQLGSRAFPSPGFLLFITWALWPLCHLSWQCLCGFLSCEWGGGVQGLVSSIQPRASPGFVRCLLVLLSRKKERSEVCLKEPLLQCLCRSIFNRHFFRINVNCQSLRSLLLACFVLPAPSSLCPALPSSQRYWGAD